jgi:hypothetical protein
MAKPINEMRLTYESWIIRRESWLPPFPLTRRYDRDRDATSRFESKTADCNRYAARSPAPVGRAEMRMVSRPTLGWGGAWFY